MGYDINLRINLFIMKDIDLLPTYLDVIIFSNIKNNYRKRISAIE